MINNSSFPHSEGYYGTSLLAEEHHPLKKKNPLNTHKGSDLYELVLCLNLGPIYSIRVWSLKMKVRILKSKGRSGVWLERVLPFKPLLLRYCLVHGSSTKSSFFFFISGQDGSIGKYGSPPCKTTSKLQLNYGTTITQNHQKLSWMEVWQPWNWRNHIHPDS